MSLLADASPPQGRDPRLVIGGYLLAVGSHRAETPMSIAVSQLDQPLIEIKGTDRCNTEQPANPDGWPDASLPLMLPD